MEKNVQWKQHLYLLNMELSFFESLEKMDIALSEEECLYQKNLEQQFMFAASAIENSEYPEFWNSYEHFLNLKKEHVKYQKFCIKKYGLSDTQWCHVRHFLFLQNEYKHTLKELNEVDKKKTKMIESFNLKKTQLLQELETYQFVKAFGCDENELSYIATIEEELCKLLNFICDPQKGYFGREQYIFVQEYRKLQELDFKKQYVGLSVRDEQLRGECYDRMLENIVRYVHDKFTKLSQYFWKPNDAWAEVWSINKVMIMSHIASRRYDPYFTRPTTYFDARIQAECGTYINNNIQHVKPHYAKLITKIKRAITFYEAEGITDYNEYMIAERTKMGGGKGLSVNIVRKVLDIMQSCQRVSVDTPIKNDDRNDICTIGDTLRSNLPTPEEAFFQKEYSNNLINLLHELLSEEELTVFLLKTSSPDFTKGIGLLDGDSITKNNDSQNMRLMRKKDRILFKESSEFNYVAETLSIPARDVRRIFNSALSKLSVNPELQRMAGADKQRKKVSVSIQDDITDSSLNSLLDEDDEYVFSGDSLDNYEPCRSDALYESSLIDFETEDADAMEDEKENEMVYVKKSTSHKQ